MSEISFRLIRKANPDLNFDVLEDISNICLNNCDIASIDNLELFVHIKELYINHNLIRKIENLEFFSQLEFLDLSYNKIESSNLEDSFSCIPKNLKFLNISGNPCIRDEIVLTRLQDAFPSLNIIIEELNDDNEDEAVAEAENQDSTEEIEIGSLNVPTLPLNTDEVLKAIVERKSKLQSYSSFNINSAISV